MHISEEGLALLFMPFTPPLRCSGQQGTIIYCKNKKGTQLTLSAPFRFMF